MPHEDSLKGRNLAWLHEVDSVTAISVQDEELKIAIHVLQPSGENSIIPNSNLRTVN